MTADILLAPHTHWDREWYEPFQRFRLRLVELLDAVLEQAESEPRFCFTLDGQMAAVDDYLEIRPENRDRLRALVASGQLAIGPWQILLDEFLCSGENIIRNLELGMTRAAEFGGVMPVGYLPDMFGHCAQMPQVLARAGLRHACVWRGVPAAVTTHAFRWEAPDGSSVRTEYLPDGYGSGAYLFGDNPGVDAQIRAFADAIEPWYAAGEILAMYGTDHTAPIAGLVDVVSKQASGRTVRVGTLTDYLDDRAGASETLPTVSGELRSHARANILPGVLSARPHLKLALRQAERMVERYAEPLAALYAGDWPQAYLDLAWSRLISSSCHDSVTGCGVDETAVQVAARIAEAEQAGQAVRDAVLGGIAARVPPGHLVVVNPSPEHRVGWVEADVPVPADVAEVVLELPDGSRAATQELSRLEPVLDERTLARRHLPTFFARVYGHELFGQTILAADLDVPSSSLTFTVGPPAGAPVVDLVRLRREVELVAGSGERDEPWTVRIQERQRRRLGSMVAVPAMGWTALRPTPGTAAVALPVRRTGQALDNGLVRVSVDDDGVVSLRAADGTSVADIARLVDGGDRGDTYNYAPPAGDVVVTAPVRVAVEVSERGPLRGVITVLRDYEWPRQLDRPADRRSPEMRLNETVTRLELRSGEPFVRMEIRVDNRCRDHRLRLQVPLPRPSDGSSAEGQFAVVTRGLTAEGGRGETPIPSFPAAGFVDAGEVALLLDRPSEYEVTGGGGELALTVLRSVGWLSRNVHPYRDEPAGPQLATPAAQCLGESVTRLAVLAHGSSWHADGLLAAVERWGHDFVSVWSRGPAVAGELSAAGLRVEGAGVVLSSLRRRGDWLELRLVAEHPSPVATTVHGRLTAARRCDLLGRPLGPLDVADGRLALVLQPWEIATVQLQR